ncbi:minor histocompatibility antigen H13 isoform X1 [Balaenoptera acutorostrata]|uniref:Minor histocompatibility antigen H13 isoform X1 n=1 Tax=Balaenoptera acutorostrata TaxID=9767 RepID=A0ABM3S5S3_BALAC|nr:minor histocompatibility antigen H13 isoform X1 [Balaenoptera acutorostrata]
MDSALSDPHNGSVEAGGPTNGTTRPPSTPEGIALAYGSLLLMALLPIFFGALRSVRCARGKNASDMPETITSRDAARFPIIASCTLLGLYLFFKIFSQEYINLLLSMYFFVLGILALSHTISPFMNKFFPANFPNRQYQLLFTQGSGENKEEPTAMPSSVQGLTGGRGSPAPGSGLTRPLCPEIINYEFDTKDLVCLGLSSIVGVWYLLRKHWIANNLFGLAFSLNGVELLHLNNVSTGCILLGGLFIYDIFWVFGTNVMVTVAKSFEAPIKLVFPQDLLEKGLEADNFAMLGLGDIVIPGIFIALLLRFDISLKKNTHTYFYTSFAAYIFGLGLTIFIMHIFKHAQPALLYLVPACIGFPVLVALAKGEVTEMFSYESSAEILPHTPRLTHFPTVSGSPASLADSMQQKLAGPRRRRPQNPSAIYEESNPKDPAAVTESKEGTEASTSKGLEKKEK